MTGNNGSLEDKTDKSHEIRNTIIRDDNLKSTKSGVGEQLKIAFDEERNDTKHKEPVITNNKNTEDKTSPIDKQGSNSEFSVLMGGIYNRLEMTEKDRDFFYNFTKNAVFIDYSIYGENAERQGFKSAGKGTYIISRIDNENKYSKEYYDCTTVCATGVDKITGENISFLSHQNPEKFLKDAMASFKNDLNDSLDEILERCLPGSVDVVVLGGNKSVSRDTNYNSFDLEKMNPQQIAEYFDEHSNNSFETYRKSIAVVSRIIFEKTKSYPTVLTGPNNNVKIDNYKESNALDVYVDTKNKRIYQIRPQNKSIHNENFKGNEINDKIINFQKT